MLTANSQTDPRGVRYVFEQELALFQNTGTGDTWQVREATRERPSQIIRRGAVASDAAPRSAPRDEPLASFWRALTTGQLRIVETFANRQRICTIAEQRPNANQYSLTERELILLRRTFQGETQKVLASGFDLSVAAISQLLGGALRKLGVSCRVGCTPLPVVMVALASSGALRPPAPFVREIGHQGGRYLALGLPALDPSVLPGLSPAERQVAVAHAVGGTYGEIAARRDTSARTVANQIASLSKKLGARGRFDLIKFWSDLQWGENSGAR